MSVAVSKKRFIADEYRQIGTGVGILSEDDRSLESPLLLSDCVIPVDDLLAG